eukprot:5802741-Pleurochrysis_carterae.AAC.3
MEGEPYGFEASWADMSDDSERGAWEEYNQAKQTVYAMIKDASYEIPDMGIPDPSLILVPVMAASMIPRYDWNWTCGMDLRDTLKDCCVASAHDLAEWVTQKCRPPPEIQNASRIGASMFKKFSTLQEACAPIVPE